MWANSLANCCLFWIKLPQKLLASDIEHTIRQTSQYEREKLTLIGCYLFYASRSPWSNTYEPELPDGAVPSAKLRELEMHANEAFDVYREMYVLLRSNLAISLLYSSTNS